MKGRNNKNWVKGKKEEGRLRRRFDHAVERRLGCRVQMQVAWQGETGRKKSYQVASQQTVPAVPPVVQGRSKVR